MVLSTNSRVGYVGCFSTGLCLTWSLFRISGFVSGGAAVTE